METSCFQAQMKVPLEERITKSNYYMEKYKDVVPVFIESHSKDIIIP